MIVFPRWFYTRQGKLYGYIIQTSKAYCNAFTSYLLCFQCFFVIFSYSCAVRKLRPDEFHHPLLDHQVHLPESVFYHRSQALRQQLLVSGREQIVERRVSRFHIENIIL